MEAVARQELESRLDLLSEFECAQLLRLFDDVTVGQRFWETEIGTLYNERVKFRSLERNDGAAHQIPAAPETAAGIFAPIPIRKSYPSIARVRLPAPSPLSLSVGDALSSRRSRRDYVSSPMSVEALATLLHHAAGVTGMTTGYGYDRLALRTFPSSGGLQVPEVYVSVQLVQGIAPGLYHFEPRDGTLGLLKSGHYGDLLKVACLGQSYVEAASIVVIITGCFDRLRWKYGQRAYRYMCMDIGYVGQSLYLVGEALGLGVCAIAGFMDDAVERFLDLESRDEIPLLLTAIGLLAEQEGTES